VRANEAEEYFSRWRRAEIGIHHHIAGAYLLRYAQESSWREYNRRVSNGIGWTAQVWALLASRAGSRRLRILNVKI
jgi:ISXO2-like transposase domain